MALIKNLIIVLPLIFGINAHAQQGPGQWIGEFYSVLNVRSLSAQPTLVLINEKNVIQTEIPSLGKDVDFPVLPSFRSISLRPLWHNDTYYSLARGATEQREDGSRFMRFTYAKYKDDKWEFLGFLEVPDGESIKIFPCDNDRFIVVSSRTDLIDNNRPDRSPFHLAKLGPPPRSNNAANLAPNVPYAIMVDGVDWSKGQTLAGQGIDPSEIPSLVSLTPVESMLTDQNRVTLAQHNAVEVIKLDSSIYHGMDDFKDKMSDPAWFRLAGSSHTVMTDSHATLINRNTGLFWIFSLEKANLVKVGNIFKKITPEMLSKRNFLMGSAIIPVLCVNPEIDGTILIAAEDEDFFLSDDSDPSKEANEIYQNMPEPKTRADYIKIFEQKLKERHERNPYIVWHRLYPESGKVERLPDAPLGGTTLKESPLVTTFRPMPDGTVKMGNVILEEAKKVQEDKDPAQSDAPPKAS